MSKKKIKAEEYNNYGKTIMFDLGKAEGKFDKIYMTPLQALKELVYGQEYIKGSDVEEHLYHIIETALKRLEIVKNKEVNVFIFLHSGDLETYNDMVEDNRKLTQEEYELLKEILL